MRRDGTDECLVYVEIADSSSVAVVDRHGVENRCLATGWTRVLALLADGTRRFSVGSPKEKT